jgi:hypothetical protein
MPVNDALFWIGLTLFGTGSYFVLEGRRSRFVICVTIIGVIATGYPIYTYYHPKMAISIPVWIYLLILTWLFVAYDVYLRFRNSSDPQSTSTSINGARASGITQNRPMKVT